MGNSHHCPGDPKCPRSTSEPPSSNIDSPLAKYPSRPSQPLLGHPPIRRQRVRLPVWPFSSSLECAWPNKGKPCGANPPRGQSICIKHGGNKPEIRKAAKQRLLELVDPALAALSKILTDPNADDAVKVRSALGVLDRTGFGPGQTVTVGVSKFDELIQSVTGEVVVDRSLGGVDPRAELEERAYAALQLSNDANAEAWREYDSEDAEAYEAGRIRPDEHTVRGEVVDTPKPKRKTAPGHEPTPAGASPLDFGDRQAPLGSTEYEQAPYAAGRGGDGPMTTEQRIRAGSVDARNDRGQRPVDIDPDDPRAQRARANAKRGRRP